MIYFQAHWLRCFNQITSLVATSCRTLTIYNNILCIRKERTIEQNLHALLYWHDLITFSSTKLNRTGDNSSPCLRPVLTSKPFDKPLSNFTLHIVCVLHVSMRSIRFWRFQIPLDKRNKISNRSIKFGDINNVFVNNFYTYWFIIIIIY